MQGKLWHAHNINACVAKIKESIKSALGELALYTRMRTSTCTGPMLGIN